MFAVMDGRKQIRTFRLLSDAFEYATALVGKQPLTRKAKGEVARTTTYTIVEV